MKCVSLSRQKPAQLYRNICGEPSALYLVIWWIPCLDIWSNGIIELSYLCEHIKKINQKQSRFYLYKLFYLVTLDDVFPVSIVKTFVGIMVPLLFWI